jgi:hypothetical protein
MICETENFTIVQLWRHADFRCLSIDGNLPTRRTPCNEQEAKLMLVKTKRTLKEIVVLGYKNLGGAQFQIRCQSDFISAIDFEGCKFANLQVASNPCLANSGVSLDAMMALAAYRQLLRATRIAFIGDHQLLHAARTQARQGFDNNSSLEPSSKEATDAVKHAEGVAEILKHNIVQGKRGDDPNVLSKSRLSIRPSMLIECRA